MQRWRLYRKCQLPELKNKSEAFWDVWTILPDSSHIWLLLVSQSSSYWRKIKWYDGTMDVRPLSKGSKSISKSLLFWCHQLRGDLWSYTWQYSTTQWGVCWVNMTSLAEKSMLFITLAKGLPTVRPDTHCSTKLYALWHGLLVGWDSIC